MSRTLSAAISTTALVLIFTAVEFSDTVQLNTAAAMRTSHTRVVGSRSNALTLLSSDKASEIG